MVNLKKFQKWHAGCLVAFIFLSPPQTTTGEHAEAVNRVVKLWNLICLKDSLDFFRTTPLLVQRSLNNSLEKGSLRGLAGWKLVQQAGGAEEWLRKGWLSDWEYHQAKQAENFLTRAQEAIRVINPNAETLSHELQENLFYSPEMISYFLEGQPLSRFYSTEKYEQVSEMMRYFRQQELILWLLSRKILRRTWCEIQPDEVKTTAKDERQPDGSLNHFRVINRVGVFFSENDGLEKGFVREIGYWPDKEGLTLEKELDENPVLIMELFLFSLKNHGIPLADEVLEAVSRAVPKLKELMIREKNQENQPVTNHVYDVLWQIVQEPTPSIALTPMLVYGLLPVVIPEFERLNQLAIFADVGHRYTVDAHTLQALRYLEQVNLSSHDVIIRGYDEREFDYMRHLKGLQYIYANSEQRIAKEFRHTVRDVFNGGRLPLLYLAVLLHDIGKPTYGLRDHDFKGAYEIAPLVLSRLGVLSPSQREEIEWLIVNDPLLKEVPPPEMIQESAEYSTVVDLLEKANRQISLAQALILLYYVDRKAVQLNPDERLRAENLDSLIYISRVLHEQAEDPDFNYQEWLAWQQRRLEADLKHHFKDHGREEEMGGAIAAYLRMMPFRGMLGKDVEQLAEEVDLLRHVLPGEGQQNELIVSIRPNGERLTEILVLHRQDRPGLLSFFTGVFFLHGIDIRNSEINTSSDGVVFNRFIVEMNGAAWENIRNKKGKNLENERRTLEKVLTEQILILLKGRSSIESLFKNQKKPYRFVIKQKTLGALIPIIPSKVDFQDFKTDVSAGTIVRIITNDRIGLMHIISRIFYDYGINIQKAPRVETIGFEARDEFYVDREGGPLSEEIREKLKKELELLLVQEVIGDALSGESLQPDRNFLSNRVLMSL